MQHLWSQPKGKCRRSLGHVRGLLLATDRVRGESAALRFPNFSKNGPTVAAGGKKKVKRRRMESNGVFIRKAQTGLSVQAAPPHPQEPHRRHPQASSSCEMGALRRTFPFKVTGLRWHKEQAREEGGPQDRFLSVRSPSSWAE